MKKMRRLVASTILGTCILAGGRADAQVFEKGPYYPYPSWDQQLPASTRFVVLTNWGSQAVLDRETGLVWERAPVASDQDWPNALRFCRSVLTGGRAGWRLPTEEELATLIDPTQLGQPVALPVGHPFQGIGFSNLEFWTASTFEGVTSFAYIIDFSGIDLNKVAFSAMGVSLRPWCVRGGSGAQNPIQGLP